MVYQRMGVDSIIEKVKQGGYKTHIAATRGLGKARISPEEKAKVQKAIDAHFKSSGPLLSGAGSNTPPPPIPTSAGPKRTAAGTASKKKTSKKKTSKKKKAAPKKKAASKKNSKPHPKKAAAGKRKKGTAVKARRPQGASAVPQPTTEESVSRQELAGIHLANERIGTISQAINAMKVAKEVHPKVNLEELSQAAVDALTGIVHGVAHNYSTESADLDPKLAEVFHKTSGAGNEGPPVDSGTPQS